MTSSRHGISVGIDRVGEHFLLVMRVQGTLTHQDYETFVPMLESALETVREPKIKCLFDGTQMEGWELRAAWDDLKLGLKHGNEFEKIAIYGNKNWQQITAKVGSWFISGEAKYFADEAEALAWLNQE